MRANELYSTKILMWYRGIPVNNCSSKKDICCHLHYQLVSIYTHTRTRKQVVHQKAAWLLNMFLSLFVRYHFFTQILQGKKLKALSTIISLVPFMKLCQSCKSLWSIPFCPENGKLFKYTNLSDYINFTRSTW